MGLDYLDQMIIHAPQPWNEFRDTKRYFAENKAVWRALEDAQATGQGAGHRSVEFSAG